MTESTRTAESATVDVLTAEVRVLMVGSRQVTMSVYKQLDEVGPEVIVPFGRVSVERGERSVTGPISVVGRGSETGQLVRSTVRFWWNYDRSVERMMSEGLSQADAEEISSLRALDNQIHDAWRKLPLIVLAGLR